MIDFVAPIGEPCGKDAGTNPARERFMASELGYGQPMGGIAQTAFIVPNLHEAIGRWVTDMRAGPFFVLPNFLVPGQTYRGEESRADITIAMGFAGHMLIELIQPLDDEPSVYKETIELRGFGFHHVGIACADVDADSLAYQARGYHEAFRAAVPTGGEVVYLDNGSGRAARLHRAAAGDPGHGRDLHPLLGGLPRLGRQRSRPLLPLIPNDRNPT